MPELSPDGAYGQTMWIVVIMVPEHDEVIMLPAIKNGVNAQVMYELAKEEYGDAQVDLYSYVVYTATPGKHALPS